MGSIKQDICLWKSTSTNALPLLNLTFKNKKRSSRWNAYDTKSGIWLSMHAQTKNTGHWEPYYSRNLGFKSHPLLSLTFDFKNHCFKALFYLKYENYSDFYQNGYKWLLAIFAVDNEFRSLVGGPWRVSPLDKINFNIQDHAKVA